MNRENLKIKIHQDLMNAMKTANEIEKNAIRSLKTEISKFEKEKKRESTDIEISQIAASLVKQRKEAADIYSAANKIISAQNENYEATILSRYSPVQFSISELTEKIKEILEQITDKSNKMKAVGQVIGIFNKQYKGMAENATVKLVAETLISS